MDLHNRARALDRAGQEKDCEAHLHGIALAELVAFMEDLQKEDIAPVFKLTDLTQMYKNRLEQLGVVVDGRIHSSRLKDRLLSALPDLQAHLQGNSVILSFNEDFIVALTKACDFDDDAMHLVRAAQIVRKEVFEKKNLFDGSFKHSTEQEAVAPSLMALVRMILDGPSIKHQSDTGMSTSRAALSISQILMFNSVKYCRGADSVNHSRERHNRDRETPLALYVAFKLHVATRKRSLIDALFNLGNDRLLQLTSDLGNGVCERFELDGVVCPPKMRSGLFTVAAVDNLDYNPSATTAKDSFHGTGISLMQHPSHTFGGHDRGVLIIDHTVSHGKRITPLPQKYTSVFPAAFKTKEFNVPPVNGSVQPTNFNATDEGTKAEWKWLEVVKENLKKSPLQKSDWITWSAYHSNMQTAVIPPAAINVLLPLFLDSAHSVAMIRHF